MATDLEEEICLSCFLKPHSSTAAIYGWSFFHPCFYETAKTNYFDTIYTFLTAFIEFSYWEHFILVLLMTIPYVCEKVPCFSWYSIINYNSFVRFAIAIFALIVALNFSIIKRTKLTPILKMKGSNFFPRQELRDKIHSHRKIAVFIVIFMTIVIQVLNVFVMYPSIENRKKFQYEALFCSMEVGIWICIFVGGFIHFTYLLNLIVITVMKLFKNVSDDLYFVEKNDDDLRLKLRVTMTQHAELWNFTTQFNGVFNYPLAILYGCFLVETSLLYYITAFVEMEFICKVLAYIINCLFTCGCLLMGFRLSTFTSIMQTSFQDIRRFADCDLSLEEKLKILNFMKRFGKASLCLTINGYFNVTKKFPIKMASTLHSMFSGILRLSGVSEDKISCQ
ncbi:uncharacterized protein [Centruroides vittatus]|uniref:uncharacterized protein n=1 Tax=Centruroides vittatus TaxID=120091 RepID=UPI0035103171